MFFFHLVCEEWYFFYFKHQHSHFEITRFAVCVATYTAWFDMCKCCQKVEETEANVTSHRVLQERCSNDTLSAELWFRVIQGER